MIGDTTYRDRTQVVSRWNHRVPKISTWSRPRVSASPEHNILMIDQLWLWKIPGAKSGLKSDTLITCFPTRHEAPNGNIDDVRDRVLLEGTTRSVLTIDDLIVRILAVCSDIFEPSDIPSLQFLEFFESAIGSTVCRLLPVEILSAMSSSI